MEQGLNHTELINMVEQGVRAALENQTQEQTSTKIGILRQQVRKMRTYIAQMDSAHAAQQPAQQQPVQQQPFQHQAYK